ncbi:ROK family protein [Shewanella sp. 1CM18E]|uniref:ROK family protein n=1 Tax=Shewanella sp. 1CM18E TaxID=2929169 RepID=UPI0020C118ED|nr:ROK family protein [Shewanella sp. 1CM18E]MCK8043957.1 ROK family protein [Shewanella sp. 1CM18E]
MSFPSIVTLDIGGTKINAGRYVNGVIEESHSFEFRASASSEDIEDFIIHCIDTFFIHSTVGIAIGVPCIVDTQLGVVYDAVNIPAWKEFALKQRLERHYNIEVYINNDVNCFTVGEHLFGAGKGYNDIIGLCLGTGVGSGFVIQNQLYQGHNCSAGEVGEIGYLNSTIDDYCSGRFFELQFGINGAQLAQSARAGDKEAIDAFEQFGQHLSHAISHLLLVVDPQVIIIGGSVAKSFDLFIKGVWNGLAAFPYQKLVSNLVIAPSSLSDSALLGAAQLHLASKR